MTNLSAISSVTSSVTALSNLILISPQNTVGYQGLNPLLPNGSPSGAPLPKTFVFDYEGENTASLDSDITDHYVENNISVQDQIALKPEIITVAGFIGDLNDIPANAILQALKLAADKLTTVVAYQPKLTTSALIAYSEAQFLYQTGLNAVNALASTVESIGNAFTGNSGSAVIGSTGQTAVGSAQSKQQIAFQRFYGFWRRRTLFNIQTPWAVFQNMAIFKLRAIQDAETNVITNFEVTFKMIRMAKTTSLIDLLDTSPPQGRLASQASGLVNNGTSAPVTDEDLTGGLLSSLGIRI